MSLAHKVILWVMQRRGYLVVDSVGFKEWLKTGKYSSSPNQNGGFKKCCFPLFRRDFQKIRKACDKPLVFARKKMKKKWREKFLNIKVGKLHNANKQEPLNKNERHSKDWNWKYWINRIFFFSGVSFTFDYGKGNAQFRKLSLFIFLNSRETTFWLPVH